MDWKDSSGSSTSSWMLSVSSVANDSSSVGTFMGCAPKGGAGSRLQLIPISLVVTFSTACTPRKVREKSGFFFLLTHEQKIYITEYTTCLRRKRERKRGREKEIILKILSQ